MINIIFFFIFSVFVYLNWHPGLGFFDASEFAVHIRAGGIAHAPGYPLYILLCRIFFKLSHDAFLAQVLVSWISVGWIIFAFYKSLNSRLKSTRSISLCVIIFLSSFLVKFLTLVPEVFMLNLALYASLGWALAEWFESDDSKKIFWVFLIYGLGLCHHHILALSLPAFALLTLLKDKKINIEESITFSLLGFSLGALPLAYLFWPLSQDTWQTYKFVNTLRDFLSVMLRKDYGTFSLAFLKASSSLKDTFTFFLSTLHKNFNGLELIFSLILISWIASVKEIRKINPLLIYSLVTLFVFCIFFLPNSNIPLSLFIYKNTFIRFLSVPVFLLLYPLAYSFDWLFSLMPARQKLTSTALSLIVLISNFSSWKELHFKHYDFLDVHLKEGFDSIFSNKPSEGHSAPKNDEETFSTYYKCAIYARSDSLFFALTYYNRFLALKRCYIFSPSSFSASFRSMPEMALKQEVFANEAMLLAKEYENKPNALMQYFFKKLKEKGFQLYLFYEPDFSSFESNEYSYLPLGNILELSLSAENKGDILAEVQLRHEAYLKSIEAYLTHSHSTLLPSEVIDEVMHTAFFQNMDIYKRFFKIEEMQNNELKIHHSKVEEKILHFLGLPAIK